MKQETKHFIKELNKLMLPIAFQTFMLAAVAASDSIMLSAVSQESLAAVSLASRMQFVQNIGIAAITGGGMVINSQYFGSGDNIKIKNIFAIMLRYLSILSILFWSLTLFVPNQIMTIFTNDQVMIEIGVKYLKIASWSYLIVGITQGYLSMLKVANKASLGAIISGSAVVINILLNAILIFGLFNTPKLGVEGAALATVIARAIELILVLIFYYKNKTINASNIFKINKEVEGKFWTVTKLLVLNEAIWGIGITLYSVIIGHLGSEATAANSIAAVIKDLVTSLCRGVGVAGGIMIGYSLGCNALKRARFNGDILMKMSFIVGLICAALILLSTPIAVNINTLDSEAKKYLFYMLLMCSVYMIAKSINICAINGIFYAGGDTKFDAYSLGITMWGIIIPLGFIGTFVLNWPVLIIYIILSLDEIVKIPWVISHYKKYKWLNNLTK